jgi:hypothetical protein
MAIWRKRVLVNAREPGRKLLSEKFRTEANQVPNHLSKELWREREEELLLFGSVGQNRRTDFGECKPKYQGCRVNSPGVHTLSFNDSIAVS